PGQAELAPEQEPTNDEDAYWNDDPARSLHSPSDMVPFKTRADVLLVGHAFAPNGEPVRMLQARLTVAEVDKAIDVVCDRAWTPDQRLVEGPRFAKMPLRWERAAGGPDTDNPIGMRGRDAQPDGYGNVAVPNLQPPGAQLSSPSDVLPTTGYGPIAPNWPPRARLLGRHAQLWARARRPMEPVPADLDAGYFNSAPADQQPELIRADERIVLQNLHPEHPRLVTNLPGIRPVAYLERGEHVEEISLLADTLMIDTDRGECTVTWRGRVDDPPESGRLLVAMEVPGEPLTWADVERMGRGTGDFTDSATVDLPDMMTSSAPIGAQEATTAQPAPRRGVRLPARSDHDLAQAARPEVTVDTSSAPPPISARAPMMRGGGGTKVAPAPQAGLPSLRDTSSDDTGGETAATATGRAASSGARSVLPFAPASAGPSSVFRSPAQPLPKPPLPSRDTSGGTVIHELPRRAEATTPSWLVTNDSTAADSRGDNIGPAWLAPNSAAPASPPAAATFVPVPPVAFVAPPAPVPSDSPWAGGSSLGKPSPSRAPSVAPPPIDAGGSVSSAAAASNAAAAPHWSQQEPPKTPPPPAPAAAAVDRRASYSTDAVELLWFDPEAAPRLKAYWAELIAELGFEELDPKLDLPSKDPDEARARHDAFGVLAGGNVLDGAGLQRAMLEAVGDRGRFTPPLVLTAGELTFPLDELEQLKATVAAIAPFVGGDAKLKNAVDAVNELLASGCLMSSSSVVERLTQQLRDAFRDSGKASNTGYLDVHVERILLEQRHYQRRDLFGDTFLRALASIPGAEGPIPAYLPDVLSKRLPMLSRMRARFVAELSMQQDQYEVHPHALRVVALGRVVPLDSRRKR
ncbi:MAG TPA: DUF2169 domain-containing protein, partial [Byssovorax sp.]